MGVRLTDDTSIIYTHASNIYRRRPAVSRAFVLSLVVLALAARGETPSAFGATTGFHHRLPVPAGQGSPPAGQPSNVDGVTQDLFAPSGPANVLLFVTSDCPISNGYAPEIQRLCTEYRKKGVSCTLVYEDATIDPAAVRTHREAFGYRDIAAVIDTGHAIAAMTKTTVTPQAVIVATGGAVKYCGRIDNRYEELGKRRRVVTVHDLRDALDDVLAGRAVARPATAAVGCFIPFGPARSAFR
jgi:hypothetical protein